jgi:hypothetical protein
MSAWEDEGSIKGPPGTPGAAGTPGPIGPAGPVTRLINWSAKASGGLAAGKVAGFFTAPFDGVISAWTMTVDQGDVTWRVWKIASGVAKPTVANNISAAGLHIVGGVGGGALGDTHVPINSNVSDFNQLSVAQGDTFAVEIIAVSGGAIEASGQVFMLQLDATSVHLLNSLVGYWKLDEGSGAVLADSKGTNNFIGQAGTVANPFAGKINSGQYFAGGYWSIASNPQVSVTGDFTFSLWVTIQNPAQTDNFFLIKSDLSSITDYYIGHNATNGFHVGGGASPSNEAKVGAPATASTWYHLIAWYDATDNKFRLRVNDAVTYVSPFGGSLTAGAGALMLGNSIGSINHLGMLDEIGFWKRKLTVAEMSALFHLTPFASFTP